MALAAMLRRARRHRRLAAAALLVGLGFFGARTGRAAGVASLVDWDAPEGCPGVLEVYGRVSSLLGYEPEALGKLSRVGGSVQRTANGFRLVLQAFERERRSARLFHAASCDDLTDAAVFAIVLAMAPEAEKERDEPSPVESLRRPWW